MDDADAGGMTAQEGLSRRKVVSNVGSFIKPSDRRNPTFSEHESPLQRLVKGGAPESRAEAGSKPFTVCLELMENVTVRTMGKKKAKMRVYPLILMCRAMGVVHAQVACGHSMSAFLVQWDHFVAIHGRLKW